VITCEAMFALPHKASFDDGQSIQRFAVLNKIITDLFEGYLVMDACCTYHALAADSPVEQFVRADMLVKAQPQHCSVNAEHAAQLKR
jgi:hypothetical protein